MKRFAILSVFFLLTLAVMPGLAQEDLPPLTEEYTTEDGRLTVQFPSDWVAVEDDLVFVIHQDAMPELEATDTVTEGHLAMGVFWPALFADLDLSEDVSAQEAMDVVLPSVGADATNEITPYETSALSGLSTVINDPDGGMPAQVIALEFETGTVLIIFRYAADFEDNREAYLALSDHLVSGVSFDGQSAAAESAPNTVDEDEVIRQWASRVTGSSQYGTDQWGFMQAAGAPDTPECGDYGTAWASSASDGVEELVLEFRYPVIPQEINIYQNYNPGAIVAVELGNTWTGDVFELPDSADPVDNTPCPGVFTVPVEGIETAVNVVTLYLDQSVTQNWNEIDAVELVGEPDSARYENEVRQWASDATGSSQYREEDWGFIQATGAPDVESCGDNALAWASAVRDTEETLELYFDQAVIPWRVDIHQTYNPGAIIAVELVNSETGEVIELENSADPVGNTPCPGIFSIFIEGVETPVNGVIIHLDQSEVRSWNEIDAVELIGEAVSEDD